MSATVLIMAGGTGGHVYPALTIARELQERGIQVHWLGTAAGLEARVIGETDIPLHFISITGLRGKRFMSLLLAPLKILGAIWQSVAVMRRVRPDCVLGMGGFVTGPGGVAARLAGAKLLIHEQNAIAGLTNQLLCPLANVVMEAFPGAFARKRELGMALLKAFIRNDKPVVVGNPVRADILAISAPQERIGERTGPLRLLVVGGSLGAAAINRVVPAALRLLDVPERPLVMHQCGTRNLEETLGHYESAGLSPTGEMQVLPYIDDMVHAYGWADVVLCRAGASTIAELTAIGLPAILVPYPHAVDDHQSANAAILEKAGGATVIPQGQLNPDRLAGLLVRLGHDRAGLLRQAEKSLNAGTRDGGTRAAGFCLELCHA